MGRERVILCGGLTVPGVGVSDDTLALNLWTTSGAINVALPVDDIRGKFWRALPPAFLDLIEIATYVFAADQATTRGGMDVDTFGGSWRRSFDLHIPVRELDVWKSDKVKSILCKTLGFLSDDSYEFTFYPAKDAPLLDQYLSLGGGAGLPEQPERVVMFSGGLDSLSGVVEETVVQKRRIVLVNHRPTPKVNGIHTELQRLLAEKAGAFRPMLVPVRINKEKKMGREPSQRSRSFLYAALGAAVARMLGLDSVRFYENGVVSINLPVCEQVIGARATRTTHPRVLKGFEELLSILAGGNFRIENPFSWETKGEIVQRLVKAGCGPLIGASMSCAHTWKFTLEHPHCGTCSQCIDRRLAVIAAGAEDFDPMNRYAVDIFTQSIPEPADRTMVAEYLEQANTFRNVKDVGQLLSDYSEAAGVLSLSGPGCCERGGVDLVPLQAARGRGSEGGNNDGEPARRRYSGAEPAGRLRGADCVRVELATSLPVKTVGDDGQNGTGDKIPAVHGPSETILKTIHRKSLRGELKTVRDWKWLGAEWKPWHRGISSCAKRRSGWKRCSRKVCLHSRNKWMRGLSR